MNETSISRAKSFEVDTKNHTDWNVAEKVQDSNKLEPTAARLYGHHEAEQIESRRNCGSALNCGDEHISHVKFQHEFTCENCNNISINETQVRCHIQNHHEFYYIRETIQDEEELEAPFCGTMSENKTKLRRHMSREHNDHGELVCKSCGNLFNAQKDLRVHITRTYKNDEDEEGNVDG